MEHLSYIDEHVTPIGAPRELTWTELVHVLRASFGGAGLVARLLGCDPSQGTPDFAGREGETLPGFRVAEAEPGRRLVLRGRHRFSDYRLTIVLDDDGQVRARTDAAFPGTRGRLYRAAVIGTGGHRLFTRRLLGRIARRAERRAGTGPGPADVPATR